MARNQYGHVSLAQLNEMSFTYGEKREMVASGRLVPVRRGVYRLCGVAPSWRGSAMAALLAAGPAAVLSHRSAAVAWGLLDHTSVHGPLEITMPSRCRLAGVRAHRHGLSAADLTVRLGLQTTTAARTLLDLAESTDERVLGELCDEALRRRLVTLEQVRLTLVDHSGRGRRRVQPMVEVLSDRLPGFDPGANRWEQEMDRMWDRMGLPPAVRQYPIRVEGRLYIPDRAIVDSKVAVDWNGYEYHGLRGRFDRDSDRRAELASVGWFPLDFTARSSPDLICRTVLAVVEERRRLFGLAG